MGCQCYLIGGPFIAEDPECPTHGWRAEREAEERREAERMAEEEKEEEREEFAAALAQRDARIEALEKTFSLFKANLLQIGDGLVWTKVADSPPVPGLIVKRFKNGSVWAGYYTGSEKESSFVEYIQLPE